MKCGRHDWNIATPFGAVVGDAHLEARPLQQAPEQQRVHRLVFDDQNAALGLALGEPPHARRRDPAGTTEDTSAASHRQLDAECRTLARRAPDTDDAAHQLHELAHDAQAEPGPSLFGLVAHLDERLEDPLLVPRGDAAAGVLDFDDQRDAMVVPTSRLDRRRVTPPCAVNLTALPTRLSTICRSLD